MQTRYFTGKPCKHGHIAERLVSNRGCVECGRVKVKRYAAANPEKVKRWSEITRKRVAGSPSRLAANRKYRKTHQEQIKTAAALYYQHNREKFAARKKRVKQATPPWVSMADIEVYYDLARHLSEDNIKWSVDHIVPIHGKDVCGLHVPWNLMLMPLDTNRLKGRRPLSDLVTRFSAPE